MNIAIIPIDGAVYIDGVSYSNLQISAPEGVHALQWKSTKGWIEFVDSDEGVKPQNESITELPEWATVAMVKWQEAKDAEEAAIAAAVIAAQEAKEAKDAEEAAIAAAAVVVQEQTTPTGSQTL